jgi:hypothetical protein
LIGVNTSQIERNLFETLTNRGVGLRLSDSLPVESGSLGRDRWPSDRRATLPFLLQRGLMPKNELRKSNSSAGETTADQIARIRKELGSIDSTEMFSRYRQMYKCINVPVTRIAAFTGEPEAPLLQELFTLMPGINKYHGVTNVNFNIVRRRARELAQDRHKFQPIHMVLDKKDVAHLLSGRHTAVALALLGVESIPLVEYPSSDEQERFRVVISANDTRQVGRYERVQHSVWQLTGGKAWDGERLFEQMVLKPSDKATFAAHLVVELGDPKLRAKFGGDQKVADAINPPGLISFLRTALGQELVDDNGKRISFRTFKLRLRRAVQFLDAYYAAISLSDRFLPSQQLGPLVLQAIGNVVNTLEDAGDEPANYAQAISDYVLRTTSDIVQENATTITARLKGAVQRAKGRRE